MGGSSVIVREDPQAAITNVPVAQGSTPGTFTIKTATLGRRHKIVGFLLTMNADGTLKFRSGGVDLTGAMDFISKGGAVERDLGSLIVGTLNNDIDLVTVGGGVNGVVQVETEAP